MAAVVDSNKLNFRQYFFFWGGDPRPTCRLWTEVHSLLFSDVWVVADFHELFWFSICRSLPEIFAIKVESCQKSRKILDDFFAIKNVLGRAFQNLHTFYHLCLASRRLKKFREDNPTRPEVINSDKLNFTANFKFSRLIFLGDPRPSWCVR